MAQRRSLAWTELRVGLLVIISFGLLAAAIFFVGGRTSVFCLNCTYKVTAYFASANGLRTGAEVWLEGVTIGNVKEVRLSQQPQADPNRSVEVEMSLDKRFQDKIRTGCRTEEADLCSTAGIGTIGILGDKNIEITRGVGGQPVQDGGYLQGKEAGDIKQIIQGSSDLVTNLKVLSDTVLEMSQNIKGGKGTLGKLMNDTSIFDNLNRATLELNALVRDARTGNGSIGRLISDPDLYHKLEYTVDQLNVTLDQVNATLVQIRSGTGTVAKLLNDPTLYDEVRGLVSRTQALLDSIGRGEGTFGKLAKDDQLYNDLHETTARVSSLLNAIENGEGAAGRFIKDPSLYNSLHQASSEVQKLLYDIRQNPKKFLTIAVRLF